MTRLQFWGAFIVLTFAAAWYLGGSIAWGTVVVLALPGILLGFAIMYGFVSLAQNWGQVLATAAGIAFIGVASRAFEDGISPKDAGGLFAISFAMIILLKGVHIYIEPIFMKFWNRLS